MPSLYFRSFFRTRSAKSGQSRTQLRRNLLQLEMLESRLAPSASTTRTLLAASQASIPCNQALTLTATVSGNSGKPDGSVTFKDGSTVLGVSTLDGNDRAALK